MSDRYQSEYYRSRDSSSHDWGKTIYAGNLQPDIGEDVIKDFFQSWGAVTSVKVCHFTHLNKIPAQQNVHLIKDHA